eukprot:gene6113-10120_t
MLEDNAVVKIWSLLINDNVIQALKDFIKKTKLSLSQEYHISDLKKTLESLKKKGTKIDSPKSSNLEKLNSDIFDKVSKKKSTLAFVLLQCCSVYNKIDICRYLVDIHVFKMEELVFIFELSSHFDQFDSICDDEIFVESILQTNGMLLRHLSDSWKSNERMVKIAFENNYKSLYFASKTAKYHLKNFVEVFENETKCSLFVLCLILKQEEVFHFLLSDENALQIQNEIQSNKELRTEINYEEIIGKSILNAHENVILFLTDSKNPIESSFQIEETDLTQSILGINKWLNQ